MKSRGPTIALCLLKTESWNGANSQSNKVLASGKKMQFDLLYTFKVSGRPFLCTLKKAAFSMYIKKKQPFNYGLVISGSLEIQLLSV